VRANLPFTENQEPLRVAIAMDCAAYRTSALSRSIDDPLGGTAVSSANDVGCVWKLNPVDRLLADHSCPGEPPASPSVDKRNLAPPQSPESVSFGFRAYVRPSPKKLNPKTMSMIPSPGNVPTHHACLRI